MLRACPAGSEDAVKATAVIERSAKAQLQIVEDLLDSARIIAGKLRIEPGPVDLVPVVEAAIDTARSAAEEVAQFLWNNRSRFRAQAPKPRDGILKALSLPPGLVFRLMTGVGSL